MLYAAIAFCLLLWTLLFNAFLGCAGPTVNHQFQNCPPIDYPPGSTGVWDKGTKAVGVFDIQTNHLIKTYQCAANATGAIVK
jgi:hypothetical protein